MTPICYDTPVGGCSEHVTIGFEGDALCGHREHSLAELSKLPEAADGPVSVDGLVND